MTDGSNGPEEERYRAVLEVVLDHSGAATELSAWLKDGSWRVRKAAAERLAQVPDRTEALEVLFAALSERGEPGVRNAAAEALAKMGPRALDPVAGLLRHSDPDQRKFAAEILGQMGLPRAEPALLPVLHDDDPNVRAAAAEALGRVGGPDSVRLLQLALAVDEPLLQLCALEALAALEAPPPLPALASLLEQPLLRRGAYRLTAQLPEAPAAELIGRGLSLPAARQAALGALGELWQRWPVERRAELENVLRPFALALTDAQPWVQAALEDEDDSVRRGAVFLVGLAGGTLPLLPIAEAAGDPVLAPVAAQVLSRVGSSAGRALLAQLPGLSLQARAVVGEALLRAVDSDWVPALLELSTQGEPDLHLFAVRALGRTGDARALTPVVLALGEPSVAHAAARALRRLGRAHRERTCQLLAERIEQQPSAPAILAYARIAGAEAAATLQRLRRQPDPTLRAAAVEGAAETGEGDPPLRLGLSDEAAIVRAAAARALGRLAPTLAEPLLRLGLGDASAEVRLAAIDAAAESSCQGTVPQLEQAAGEPDGQVASHAIRALVRLGALGPELVWTASRHPDPEVVKEVLQGTASLAEGERLALSLLAHPRWDVRAAAARALGSGGSKGSSAALEQVRTALNTEADPLVRQCLAETARVLGRR